MGAPSQKIKDEAWTGFSGVQHGFIATIDKEKISPYYFQFNPNKLSGRLDANYEMQKMFSSRLPVASFLQMNSHPIQFRLFVDASDYGSYNMDRRKLFEEHLGIWADILILIGMMNPNYKDSQFEQIQNVNRFNAPTNILLGWGPIIDKCVMTTIAWEITFWANTIPIRAEIDITVSPISSGLENDYKYMQRIQKATSRVLLNKIEHDKTNDFYKKIYDSGKYFAITGNQS